MPNAYKKAIRRSRNAIKDFQAAENADITGDYTAVNSQLAAITANLGTAGRGIGAKFTKSQQQALRAMNRQTASGLREGRRSLAKTGRQMTNEYGSAIGGATGQSALATSRALLRGTGDIRRATLGAGSQLARAGQTALSLQKTGAKEAAAGAEYATAVALKSRNMTAASQVAEMEFQLQQQILQHEQAMEQARFDRQTQLSMFEKEKEEAEVEGRIPMSQVYNSAGQMSGLLSEGRYMAVKDEEGKVTWVKRDVVQMTAYLAQSMGINPETDPDLARLAQNAAKNMVLGNMSANEAVQAATTELYADEKGFKPEKSQKAIRLGTRQAHFDFIDTTFRGLINGDDMAPDTLGKMANILNGYEELRPWADIIHELNNQETSWMDRGWNWEGRNERMILAAMQAYLDHEGVVPKK